MLLFVAVFAVVEAGREPLVTDPRPDLDAGGVGAGLVGVGLLIADVVRSAVPFGGARPGGRVSMLEAHGRRSMIAEDSGLR
ncbi:MAG: hypothetical protein M3P34_10355 [Actinomycetota bacterium]|nr:hypothetical protein [Actinomycetota bacterium]